MYNPNSVYIGPRYITVHENFIQKTTMTFMLTYRRQELVRMQVPLLEHLKAYIKHIFMSIQQSRVKLEHIKAPLM